LTSSLFVFSKIRYKIPLSTGWSLYYSIFYSHLIYCISIWGNSCTTHLHPINVLHNKFLKSLLCLPRKTSSSLLYTGSSTLSLHNLYLYSIATIIYKFTYFPSSLPSTITTLFNPITDVHSHSTRSSCSQNLFSQSSTTSIRYNCVAIQGPIIWNSLPANIKTAPSLHSFKKLLKSYLINLAN